MRSPDMGTSFIARRASARMKVVVVSTSVPPSPTGQAVALGHLLDCCSQDNCLFLTDDGGTDAARFGELTIGEYRKLPDYSLDMKYTTDGLKSNLRTLWQFYHNVRERSKVIQGHLFEYQPSIVVVCSGSLIDIPATFLACKKLALPVVSYLFDDPVMQWPPGRLRAISMFWQSIWVRLAAAVIVPNEHQAKEFRKRTGRNADIVRNPVSTAACTVRNENWRRKLPLRILYTGSVYGAQHDAILNLVQLLAHYEGYFHLDIFTAQGSGFLGREILSSPYVTCHKYIQGTDVQALQKEYDVLFLPLAFDESMRPVLKTSSPQKMGEYLTSGRPILVHAPANTFVSHFFRENKCGMVANNIYGLQVALDAIKNDPQSCADLAEKGLQVSALFAKNTAQRDFWRILERSSTVRVPLSRPLTVAQKADCSPQDSRPGARRNLQVSRPRKTAARDSAGSLGTAADPLHKPTNAR